MDFFTENRGQVGNADVRYYASDGNSQVGFADGVVLLRLVEGGPVIRPGAPTSRGSAATLSEGAPARGVLVRISFDGANAVSPQGRGALHHASQYFHSNSPAEWWAVARNYREVAYVGLYEGVDLVYRARPEGVKYEFTVRPGGDPDQIAIRYEGIESLQIDAEGVLLRTSLGVLRDSPPIAFQDGRPVPCGFALRGPSSYGFDCRGWEGARPLVIDPLLYSTFLGGSFGNESGKSIAVDVAGNAYVTGHTWSFDFPVTPGAFDATLGGPGDLFITKVNATGGSLAYSTYLGGSGVEVGEGIAVDAFGNAYVTGFTASADFPFTAGAFDTSWNGNEDAFVAKLNATGALVYSTFLGGAAVDFGYSVALDEVGNAYATGYTQSGDFPVTAGAFDESLGGPYDAYVTKLNANGTDVIYSTFLGGSGVEDFFSIAVDADGYAYVSGTTSSMDFPLTPSAFDTSLNGSEAFVTKVNASGNGLIYSTFIGGSSQEFGLSIAIDASGNAHAAGWTASNDFPCTLGAYDTTYNGGSTDVFVAKVNATGTGLAYATYLGGTDRDEGVSVAVDPNGRAVVVGSTQSVDYPVTPYALDTTLGGAYDAFVTALNAAGTTLVNSTYFGGSSWDEAAGVAPGWIGTVYLVGHTISGDFPVTPGAFDTTLGSTDAFVTKMTLDTNGAPSAEARANQTAGRNARVDLDGTGSADPNDDPLAYAWSQVSGAQVALNDATEAVAWFVPQTLGMYGFRVSVTDRFGVWAEDTVQVAVQNLLPAAAAGPNQDAFKNTIVTLNGSGSSDPDGDALSFSWVQIEGPATTLSDAGASNPWFSPRASGRYTFALTVDDGLGGMSTNVTAVAVTNRQPVAIAGDDATTLKKTLVTLHGSDSSDPDGEAITFAWTQIGGPPATLAGADTAAASFTASTSGVFTFEVAVTDGEGETAEDTVTITATNRAPVGNAGSDRTVTGAGFVALDGTASTDPDGDVLAFSWVQREGPPVQIRNRTGVVAEVRLDVPGRYEFELTVNDGDGGRTDVAVRVEALGPTVTLALAAASQLAGTVVLTGDASDGSFVWLSVDGGTPVHVPVVNGVWSYRLDTTALGDGAHTIEVKAERNGFVSAVSRIAVVVRNPPSGSPIAPILLVVALALASGVTGLFLIEPARVALLGALAVIGARLRREELFDNEKRGMIRGYLSANPGANYSTMKSDLDLGNGTLSYHLAVMEREGFIRSWHDGRLKRFALGGHRIAEIQPKLADIDLLLLQALRGNPDFTQEQLAKAVGVSQSAVSNHMKRLAEFGLVEIARRGIRKRYVARISGDQRP